MLALSRKLGESIRIGEGVIVKVLAIDPRRVRLGVYAPPNTVIDREEIYLRKRAACAPLAGGKPKT